MCTLAVAFHTDPRWPVLVAANRDERLDRPAEDWAVRALEGGGHALAPRDLTAGGTWIGIGATGVFAALTNVHAGLPYPLPDRASRGHLVLRALRHRSAADARAEVGRLDAAVYNPFHLVVADPRSAFLWRYDGREAWIDALRPGLHVVTESDHEGRSPRAERVRAGWPLDADPARLAALLARHGPSPREGTCIHLDPRYGTRSSAVVRLAGTAGASDLRVASGRPCVTPFVDRSDLIVALARLA